MKSTDRRHKNIVLIGMPGAGKSTIGVILAKVMGYRFVDSDLVIQEEEHRLLKDIIAEDGVEEFVKIENRINASLDVDKSVIATGGSVIYGAEAMEHLREIGTVVYIRLRYEEIRARLGDLSQRGVVLREGQTLLDLYNERCPLYEKYAHIAVDGDRMQIVEVMEAIKRSLLEI
ncbi:MAG: shikimate kinase [Lachnospiraceae bacterium]|nr:shikimate kinase [Lachnospiraceae bacterium]